MPASSRAFWTASAGGRGGGGGGTFECGGGGGVGDGLQGLLPGRVLQRFAEQIFDKDG